MKSSKQINFNRTKDKKKALLIILCFLALYIIWGSTYMAIKVVIESLPPFFSMGIRFVSAALILFLFLPFIKGASYKRKEIFNTSVIGFFYFTCCMGLVAWAEKYIPSGITCVLAGIIPLWYMLFDIIIHKKGKPRIIAWLGVVTGIAGIIVLVGLDNISEIKNISLLPVGAVMLAAIIWAFTAVYSTKVEKPKNRILNLSVQMFSGGIFNIIIGFLAEDIYSLGIHEISLNSIVSLLYLIVFGSIVVMLAFNYLLDNINPGLISTYSYVNPVVALLLGWLILDEVINMRIILASTLIIIGVAFIKLGDRNTKVLKITNRGIKKRAA